MKKTIIVLVLALTLVLGCVTMASASEVITPDEFLNSTGTNSEELKGLYSLYPTSEYNYMIMKDSTDMFHCFITDKNIKVCRLLSETDNKPMMYLFNSAEDGGKYYAMYKIYPDGSLEELYNYAVARQTGYTFPSGWYYDFEYSTCDIYSDDHYTEVFFPRTLPLPTLQVIAKEVEMTEVMKQILGLTPLAIGLVILAMSLRKALAMLQTILHRA
jgi:hypothetical protein